MKKMKNSPLKKSHDSNNDNDNNNDSDNDNDLEHHLCHVFVGETESHHLFPAQWFCKEGLLLNLHPHLEIRRVV